MEFTEIYNLTTKFWKPEIDISDGQDVVEPDWGNFSTLSKCWDETERKTDAESELIKIMVWAIFCGLHKKAIEFFRKGKTIVTINDIDKEYVKYKFEESLSNSDNSNYEKI